MTALLQCTFRENNTSQITKAGEKDRESNGAKNVEVKTRVDFRLQVWTVRSQTRDIESTIVLLSDKIAELLTPETWGS